MPFPSQIGRWGRGLARLFGIQGQVPITLLEDVAPMLAIGVIDPFLLAEFPWGADLNQPVVAGQFAFCALGNPENSGVLVKVDALWQAGNQTLVAGILPGPVTQTQLARGRDSRVGLFGPAGASGSVAKVGVGSNAVAQLNTGVESSARMSGASGPPLRGYILTPGFRLFVEASQAGTAINAVFHWREVPLAPQELVP